MAKDITYHWGENNLLIELGNRTESRIKVLFLGEFLITTGMATVFLLQALPLKGSISHLVATFGAALLYILASFRFLSRMFNSESILLDKYELTIIRKTPFSKRSKHYSWECMGLLHYTGKLPKTAHPLKGNSFDYFGFETHEHLVQSLHHEGNLSFTYDDGYVVSFAYGVYSWDAEQMVRMMKLYTGNNLHLGPEWRQILQEFEVDDTQ